MTLRIAWAEALFAVVVAWSGVAVNAAESSAVAPLVHKVTNLVAATAYEPPAEVTLPNGIQAVSIVLLQTTWHLKDSPQRRLEAIQLAGEARALPEAGRMGLDAPTSESDGHLSKRQAERALGLYDGNST